jgi:uncharacterized membrane protein
MRPGEPAFPLWLACLAGGAACLYALPGLLAHWQFRSNYDLAIFDQAIWHLSRFEAPSSTVRGLSNVFGDHFSPILVAIVPFYWIAPAPETLIVCQAALFALSIFPVWAFLRRRIAAAQVTALSLAYVLFWGLQRAAAFDFHEVAFAPVLIGLVVYAMDARRFRLLWAASAALSLVKEDMLPFLAFAGGYLMLQGERRQGVTLLAASVLAFWLIVGYVVPAMNDSGVYHFSGTYADALTRPWSLPSTLVTPSIKAMTILLWVAPFAFLPLFSPVVLLLIPFALARLLSSSPLHWGPTFHYSAALAPILAMAAGDGLARLTRRVPAGSTRRRLLHALPVAAVLFSLLLPGRQPMFRLFRAGQFAETPFMVSGKRALALIPSDASVVAQTAIAPHLAHRAAIYKADNDAPDADFVIAASGLSPWPLESEAALRAFLDARREAGYSAVFMENGWVVLRRKTVSNDSRGARLGELLVHQQSDEATPK